MSRLCAFLCALPRRTCPHVSFKDEGDDERGRSFELAYANDGCPFLRKRNEKEEEQ